jgi:hypothetical protein
MRIIAFFLAVVGFFPHFAWGQTLEELLRRNQNNRPMYNFIAPPPRAMVPAMQSAPKSDGFNVAGRATRLFAGPGQFPPVNYAAYGIVAFKSKVDSSDEKRFADICRAYVNAIPTAPPDLLTKDQMVTVWPVTSEKAAQRLNKLDTSEKCKAAVTDYDLSVSLDYLRRARFQGEDTGGIGPYMLAWAPTTALDQPDAIVLVADLSDVKTYEQAIEFMIAWVEDIEADPEIWKDGFTVEKLRVAIRNIVNKYGQILENSFRVKS